MNATIIRTALIAGAAGLVLNTAKAQDDEAAVAAPRWTAPFADLAVLEDQGFLPTGFAEQTCPGRLAVLRFNTAAAGASLEEFRNAVAAHEAWLASKGYGDVEVAVLSSRRTIDGADAFLFGSALIYPSSTRYQEIVDARDADRDEAYDAFVARYRDATEGFTGLRLCLEPPAAPQDADD